MCKFSSRLFVFLIIGPLVILARRDPPGRSLIDLLTTDNDYNLKYDQRQKGEENLRIKLDGFFIGIPAEPTGLFMITDDLVSMLGEELLLGRQTQEQSSLDESKTSQTNGAELAQKQLENYQKLENYHKLQKAESEVLSQRAVSDERGDYNQGSRTKLYVMNLLDYIRRNRHE